MKTSPSKKSNPKTKGSVLSASLVFKKLSQTKTYPPPTQQNKHYKNKEKRNQQRENPLLERRKRLRS
ncbi:hypothetical protein HMPREF1429_00765 [Helicobacter pylori GAM93Bi]|nr:hypothetical protein HMPREF1429_00765 [Helicobacter pylori GAM93Bi]